MFIFAHVLCFPFVAYLHPSIVLIRRITQLCVDLVDLDMRALEHLSDEGLRAIVDRPLGLTHLGMNPFTLHMR